MSQISFADFFDQAQDAAPVVQRPLPAMPVSLPAVSPPVLSLAAVRRQFISVFHETAYNLRRWEVFSDFIILAASELDIARIRTPESIERCRKISERYSAADMRNMHELFALMVCALQAQFHDFLGAVFMELELGDDRQGQYFTPYNVQSMMARLLMPGVIDTIRREGMFTLSEPTCGAGGMVIAYAECLIEAGLNPSVQMFVSCIDIAIVKARYRYLNPRQSDEAAEAMLRDAEEDDYTGSWTDCCQRGAEAAGWYVVSRGDVGPLNMQ
ncbi:N-6 DNA methylase (plasmid) [Pantoea vagans]|uniref:N-6 DNA methylase n=1 Tax=Pantoea vagans TaxID=470934 RepID=UPI00351109CB